MYCNWNYGITCSGYIVDTGLYLGNHFKPDNFKYGTENVKIKEFMWTLARGLNTVLRMIKLLQDHYHCEYVQQKSYRSIKNGDWKWGEQRKHTAKKETIRGLALVMDQLRKSAGKSNLQATNAKIREVMELDRIDYKNETQQNTNFQKRNSLKSKN